MDRKLLLLLLTLVMAVSGTIVAVAPNYPLFMLGRALIGVVIGGFWSMSAAIAIRLVPEVQVPKALGIFNAGNALATVIAAPLGSFLGAIIGWRGAFFVVVPIALLVLTWQWISLPSMKVETAPGSANVFKLLKRPLVLLGMASVGLFFMGQFALFTYVRPFLESVTRVDICTSQGTAHIHSILTRFWLGSGPPGNWASFPPIASEPRSIPAKPSRSIRAAISALAAVSLPE